LGPAVLWAKCLGLYEEDGFRLLAAQGQVGAVELDPDGIPRGGDSFERELLPGKKSHVEKPLADGSHTENPTDSGSFTAAESDNTPERAFRRHKNPLEFQLDDLRLKVTFN
jgi:hypothetical protein